MIRKEDQDKFHRVDLDLLKTDICPPFGTPEFIERHGADYVRNPDGTPRLDEKGKPVRCLSYEQMRNAQAHGY